MFTSLKFVIKYCKYHIGGKHKKGHGIHSPFLFDLVTSVLNNKSEDDELKQIFNLHDKYKKSKEPLVFKEMGAGSQRMSKKNKQESDSLIIATTLGKAICKSSVTKKYGKLLYRLVKYFHPKNILEIGTSLGISTLYLAQGASESNIITMDGVKEKIEIAKNTARELNLHNIRFYCTDFDTGLPEILKKTDTLDFVFFDGNHTCEATLKYFESCLEKAHNDSVFILDDIHWSSAMTKAWKTIKNSPKVTMSIDLFQFGILFFKTEITKGHYVIKF